MESLPIEILFSIIRLLDSKKWLTILLLNKHFNQIGKRNEFWKLYFFERFGTKLFEFEKERIDIDCKSIIFDWYILWNRLRTQSLETFRCHYVFSFKANETVNIHHLKLVYYGESTCYLCEMHFICGCKDCNTIGKFKPMKNGCAIVLGDCRHAFHKKCLDLSLKQTDKCPKCPNKWNQRSLFDIK